MSAAVRDAAPAGSGKKPDPGPDEHRLCRAALAFAGFDRAIREHAGPRAGAEYDAKLQSWRETYRALLRAASSYEGGNHAGHEG